MPARSSASCNPELWEAEDIRPAETVTLGVRGAKGDSRSWLAGSPVVAALGALGLAHAGVLTTSHPYRIVRTKLSGAYFMATLSGGGQVFLNGRWQACGEGQAVLLMPGVLNAFYAEKGRPWSHCWVRVAEGAEVLRGPADRMQVMTRWNAAPLSHAVLGLREAVLAGAPPPVLHRWAELVLVSVEEFRRSFDPDARVVRLWEAVEKHLAEPWTMSEMAQVASLSAEHLRRLSRAATGRSPHAHLMHLRMKRAAELLLSTDWPIKRIAEVVGYANPFVFSTTFKKVIGWPPSSYAARNDADGARKRQRK